MLLTAGIRNTLDFKACSLFQRRGRNGGAAPRIAGMEAEKKSRVLIVDEPVIVKMVASFLSMRGFETLGAVTVSQAKELFGKHEIDVLLIDVSIPGSPEFVSESRRSNPRLVICYMVGENSYDM